MPSPEITRDKSCSVQSHSTNLYSFSTVKPNQPMNQLLRKSFKSYKLQLFLYTMASIANGDWEE